MQNPKPVLSQVEGSKIQYTGSIMSSSLALLTPTFLSTFLLLNLLAVTPALSWFDKGHRIVGLIAQAHLTADARKEIERILPGGMTLADAAVWPDHEGR